MVFALSSPNEQTTPWWEEEGGRAGSSQQRARLTMGCEVGAKLATGTTGLDDDGEDGSRSTITGGGSVAAVGAKAGKQVHCSCSTWRLELHRHSQLHEPEDDGLDADAQGDWSHAKRARMNGGSTGRTAGGEVRGTRAQAHGTTN